MVKPSKVRKSKGKSVELFFSKKESAALLPFDFLPLSFAFLATFTRD